MAGARLHPAAQLVLILAAAGVLGTAAQFFSPSRIPWREDWSEHAQTKALRAGLAIADTDQARALVENGAVLIFDARSQQDYDAGHLPGALSLPDEHRVEAFPMYASFLVPEQRVLVYCSGKTCDESLELSLFLKEQGHTNVVLYLGGFKAWQEAQLPVVR